MLAVLKNQNEIKEQAITSTPLRVTVFGVDERAVRTLEIAFKNYGNNCAVIVEENSAQAAIFDFDNKECKIYWAYYRKKYPLSPTVILSSSDPHIAESFYLPKPLRTTNFLKIFQQIRNKLSLDSSTSPTTENDKPGHRPPKLVHDSSKAIIDDKEDSAAKSYVPVQPKQPESSSKQKTSVGNVNQNLDSQIYYSPKNHIQGVIHKTFQEALEKNVAIDLAIKIKDDWEVITFFPGLKKIATDLSAEKLRYLCSAPLYFFETKTYHYNKAKTRDLETKRQSDDQLTPFEAFIWNVALWTARGRLPTGTSLTTPLRLRRWPNLTRVNSVPHAFSIAALYSQKPMPLSLLLKLLDIPEKEVFTFFSAAYAVGLMETSATEKSVNTDIAINIQKQHPTRNIFKRIMNTLKAKV